MHADVASAPALFNGERLFSFAAIAAKLPGHRGNSHVNASTIFRWATKGVRTASGEVVRLQAVRLGTSWKSSLEAVERFTAKLTSAALPSEDPPVEPPPTPRQHQRAAAAASKKADAIFGHAK